MDYLLLRVPDAAAQLDISRAKLYEMIADGVIPTVKIGGCRRIKTEALRNYVAQLSDGPLDSSRPRQQYGPDTLPVWQRGSLGRAD
jgi:excisionase family DNA binding protein